MAMLNTTVNDLNEITDFSTELCFTDDSIKIVINGIDAEICSNVKAVIAVLRGMEICTIAQQQTRNSATAERTQDECGDDRETLGDIIRRTMGDEW